MCEAAVAQCASRQCSQAHYVMSYTACRAQSGSGASPHAGSCWACARTRDRITLGLGMGSLNVKSDIACHAQSKSAQVVLLGVCLD